MKTLCTIILFTAATVAVHAQAANSNSVISGGGIYSIPDVVYIHGDILTGSHLRASDASAAAARVTALAIAQGCITAIGTDSEILKLKSDSTKVIDLNGAFAMPGFNDAHTHIAGAGQQQLTVDLTGSKSLAEMQSRIKTYAATAPAGSWIKGGGWDHTLWASKTLPTKFDLDSVTGGHPAVFERVDGHILVANSAALAAAGITPDTPSPTGGQIDHDTSGALTGILREDSAMALVDKKIPPPSNDLRRRALELSINDALAHGVTSIQDFSDWEDFLVLEELEHAHKLHLRISEWLAFDTPLPVLIERRASHPADDPLLHIGFLKAFMDGSLGSRTAALEDPYSDDPGNSGILRFPDTAKLNKMAAERAAAGFQLGFHAIGDRANQVALDAFSAAEQVGRTPAQPPAPHDPDAAIVTHVEPQAKPADFRYRIEHAQVVEAGDFDRFAKLGVIASMQPSHLLTDLNWAAARLGPDRAPLSYTWKSFLDHGVTLAFGTDYPVESINPFRGLYAAVTRQNEAGTQIYQPQEKISINEALYAYTQASAFAEFREHEKGRLEPGFLADIVVLDRDPTKASPQELLHTQVLRTVVNGETVFISGKNQIIPVSTLIRMPHSSDTTSLGLWCLLNDIRRLPSSNPTEGLQSNEQTGVHKVRIRADQPQRTRRVRSKDHHVRYWLLSLGVRHLLEALLFHRTRPASTPRPEALEGHHHPRTLRPIAACFKLRATPPARSVPCSAASAPPLRSA